MHPEPTAGVLEWRRDAFTGRGVIIAGARGGRPGAYGTRVPFEPITRCPFCAGHETDTPFTVLTEQMDATMPWAVRVVANRYPALRLDHPPAFGRHEVIIEAPAHTASFQDLPVANMAACLRVWRNRLQAMQDIPGLKYAYVFKNQGTAAGASLEHIHSQLIGLPEPPPTVRQECDYLKTQDSDHFSKWIATEKAASVRLIHSDAQWLAFCPYVSRMPFEAVSFCARGTRRFEELEDAACFSLAICLKPLLQALDRIANKPDYNLVLVQAPFQKSPGNYPWRLEIIPRLVVEAGFEWGTGEHINSLPPEEAAKLYREAL
jgi:UDPglucose--hexose-1-phosphate uridylyltransferase